MSMTKLEAVNMMLFAIGEDPVSSLTSGLDDAENAETVLNRVSRKVQQKGWHCNTDDAVTLTPDSTRKIVLPNNTLRIDTVGRSASINVTKRGRRLYNRSDASFIFTKPITVRLVYELPWDDLDYPLQYFIACQAAQTFQSGILGSVAVDQNFTSRDVRDAWEQLLQHEAENEDSNIIDGSFDARSVAYRNDGSRGWL